MLLENFELWVLLVKLVCDRSADDVSKHRLEGLLIAVIILNGHETCVVQALLVPLAVGFLAHYPDRFVRSLYLNGLDITNWNAIDHCSLLSLFDLAFHHSFLHFDLFGGKMTRGLCVSEALLDALSLAHRLMIADDALGCEFLCNFVRNAL